MYLPLELVLGVFAVLALVVVAGEPLRRKGSPQGRYGVLIGAGAAGMIAAGAAVTLPPHSALLAGLLVLAGIGLFAIGVAVLGGGYYGFLAALSGGLAAAALIIGPTPIALAQVGQTLDCQVTRSEGGATHYITAACPNGKVYDFTTDQHPLLSGGRIGVIEDPHDVLQAEFVGQHHPTVDLIAMILSLLAAVGVVIAAALNRRRRHGQVAHVIKPVTQT